MLLRSGSRDPLRRIKKRPLCLTTLGACKSQGDGLLFEVSVALEKA